MVIFKDR